ncbi:MAG: hypothetical protein CMJ83_10140 [Planctomycetes bacterium]|nr:hypothetical protein [Planctomycetota bacterium]
MTRRTARLFALAFTCLSLGVPACGQDTLSTVRPADVGMSEPVLRAGVQLFRDAIGRDDLKGVVLLVARSGKIVLHEAIGVRDPEGKKPMRTDSLFRMASNTKPVVATAVLQLAEAGKLSIDDPVAHHLPSFRTERAQAMTIRQLLSHTSGFRVRPIFLNPLLEKSPENPDAPSLAAEVRRFGAIGAKVPPGTSYAYSNAGFNTLGALVAKVSGLPLKTYLKRNVYTPLGMADSCNHEPDADHGRMSAIFRRRGTSKKWRVGWKPGDQPDYPFPRASGGMISSAHDYAVLCQAFLNGGTYGGRRILTPESIKEATSIQTRHAHSATERASRGAYYGLGWAVGINGIYRHGGSDGTYASVDPKRQLIILVFTQSPGGKNPRNHFARVVDAACTSER